jgi:hypothetical protein
MTVLALATITLGASACSDSSSSPPTPESVAEQVCALFSTDPVECNYEYATLLECEIDWEVRFQDMHDMFVEEHSPNCGQAVLDFWSCLASTIRGCDIDTDISPAELDACDDPLNYACGLTYEDVFN